MHYMPNLTAAVTSFLMAGFVAAQPETINYKLTVDASAAVYGAHHASRGKTNEASVLPYLSADYGRFFARVDIFGIKVLPIGNGYLELVGRLSQDGWRANMAPLGGLTDRRRPIQLGMGTFQQTPYGAFIVNAFVDVASSRENSLEAIYMSEMKLGSLSLRPQLGLERRSAKYNQLSYGVSPAESLTGGNAAYNAGASTTPVLGLAADYSLMENWSVNLQLRRTWLDSAVSYSPLVVRKTQDTGYIGLLYRFK